MGKPPLPRLDTAAIERLPCPDCGTEVIARSFGAQRTTNGDWEAFAYLRCMGGHPTELHGDQVPQRGQKSMALDP